MSKFRAVFFIVALVLLGFTYSCTSPSEPPTPYTPTLTQPPKQTRTAIPSQTLAPTHTPTTLKTPSPTRTPIPSQSPTSYPVFATPVLSDFRLSFDGDDDWVVIKDTSELEFYRKDFTISLWFNTDVSWRQQQIIRKGYDQKTDGEGRWVISIDDTGVIRIVLDDIKSPSTLESLGTTRITVGKWHHLAVVFDRDEALKVYLDGELDILDPDITTIASTIHNRSSVNVYIGRSHSSEFHFEGMIRDISIWQGARTLEQIQADLSREGFVFDEDLIAFWSMQEGQGQWVFDSVGNNHGQLGSTHDPDENDPAWHLPE